MPAKFIKVHIVCMSRPGNPILEGYIRADWISCIAESVAENAQIGVSATIDVRDGVIHVKESIEDLHNALEECLKEV